MNPDSARAVCIVLERLVKTCCDRATDQLLNSSWTPLGARDSKTLEGINEPR